ncbi:hypothetical protein BDZ89DRAFT_1209927 [Hymenopellis radicata]|nr:hypothetical protein BDZ89DRAFT_1209927 [Hymenopellis radicata]
MLSSFSRHRLPRLLHLRHAPTRGFISSVKLPWRSKGASSLELSPPSITNQLVNLGRRQFLLLGSATVFTYASFRTNLETEIWTQRLTSATRWGATITNVDLRRAQQVELVKGLRAHFARFQENVASMPGLIRPWLVGAYLAVAQPYADASDGKRLCWTICLLNAGVYIAWQFRRFEPYMIRNFTHNPLSGLSFTMITSVFSHRSFLHLLFNCLALEGFGASAAAYLNTSQAKAAPEGQLEATPYFHFAAWYILRLRLHVIACKIRYPRLVAHLSSPTNVPKVTDTWAAAVSSTATGAAASTTAKAAPTIVPSLGASGAIYSCLTLTALAYPTSQIALSIPPSYPINIQWGVGGLVLLDFIGILRGWRFFDHYAHLGGAAFGVAYYMLGPTFWTGLRSVMAPVAVTNEKR